MAVLRKDHTGKTFGRLTVLSFVGRTKKGEALYLCKCKCGKEKVIKGPSMVSGQTVSCGCRKKEILHDTAYKHYHGKRNTRAFNTWCSMIQRCCNLNHTSYKEYGGRGITVCERWKEFISFFEDMGERPSGTQLERIDNNKGYFPENCCWASRKEQARNRRTTMFLALDGEIKPVEVWSEELGIDAPTIRARVSRWGWSDEEALTTPIGLKPKRLASKRNNDKTRNSYRHMVDRCYNPKNKRYSDWGGRGIQVCERWLEDYNNFLDDMGACPTGMSLDRIDNAGNYEPENCKWSTYKQQANNRRI